MIRKLSRRILSLITLLYFVFLTFFGLGDFLYPDSISRFSGDEPEGSLCFSFQQKGEEDEGEADYQLLALGFLPVKSVRVNYYPRTEVICGGEIFGLRLDTGALLVTGFGTVETKSGEVCPGEAAGIRKGDLLLSADGVALTDASTFSKIISRSGGKAVTLLLVREGKEMEISLSPAESADGSGYKAGLWVRDGAAGIGTVTFRDPVSGAFGGLGHAVCDGESGVIFPVKKGTVCAARIEGIKKGSEGTPGEIHGKLESENTGSLLANTGVGVFGYIPPAGDRSPTVSIGLKSEVETGKAVLVCTLDENGKKEYEIEIEEIIGKDRETKNFVLHVTDPDLISKTGGIIQGMSGSPILQNGKLIGAVTHVLVGDPTRGYGIFIENMLETAKEVTKE